MTFHAACARMLRAEAHAARLHAPVHDLRPGRLAAAGQALPRRARRRPQALHAGAIHHQISDAKNKLRDAEAYGADVGSLFEQTVADVYELYERELHRMNAMDFDDLLVRAVNVLELFPEVRERYASAFRHVLVDEYQDTNHAQYRLAQLLAGEHRNLAVVGDDEQSIYGFRGADIRNILDFEDDFPDAHVVKLEQNYRSTQTILDAANAVIAQQPRAEAKTLWTDLGAGDPIKRPRAGRRARRGAVRRRRDRAARRRGRLAQPRSRSSTGRTRSRGCSRTRSCAREIGYQVIGGTKFYERAEIKDALAYLTVLANPQDVVAFTRVVNSPQARHRPDVARRGSSRTPRRSAIPVWDAAADPEAVPGLGHGRASRRFGRFMDDDAARCASARRSGVPVGDLLEAVLHETGYLEALEAERTIEAQGRIENLEELVEVAPRVRRATEPGRTRRRRSPTSCSRSRSSPTPTRAATTRAS